MDRHGPGRAVQDWFEQGLGLWVGFGIFLFLVPPGVIRVGCFAKTGLRENCRVATLMDIGGWGYSERGWIEIERERERAERAREEEEEAWEEEGVCLATFLIKTKFKA